MPVICIVFCALCARNDAKLWARCIKNPVQGKYVDFEYVDEDGKVFTWSFPGTGSYKVSDILAHLNIRGTVESAELALIEGEYVEGALYLVQVRGEYYLNSQVAFDDTYRLTVVVDGKKYGIRVTDEQVNQGVTVDTYFITNEGRLQNAAADSGERLNGRVALTNSNPPAATRTSASISTRTTRCSFAATSSMARDCR